MPVSVNPTFSEDFVVNLSPAIEAGLAAVMAAAPSGSELLPPMHVSPLLALLHSTASACGLHFLLTMDTLSTASQIDADSEHGTDALNTLPAEPRDVGIPGSALASVSLDLVASQTLDWRLLLAEDGGSMHTMVRLSPSGAVAPVYSSTPGAPTVPVGLLAVELSLDPVGEGEALAREVIKHEIEQQSTLIAERSRAFFEFSKSWWTEYKSVDPSFRSRIGVKMYAPNERNEFHPVCTYVTPLLAGEFGAVVLIAPIP